jgi:hypothetical protein
VALGKLSALQQRILVALSGLRPIWTLTGAEVDVGQHGGHAALRDPARDPVARRLTLGPQHAALSAG